jgi:haloalkane dehalogenase
MTALADTTLPRREVLGSMIAYREAGDADAPLALFLHGNPTCSYIWRNVIPHVAPVARCLAPDLIGFGQSSKPEIDYRFVDHVRYLDAFLDAAGIDSAYLVAQDWGTALAFHLAARRPRFVRGLAFMEFIRPLASWEEFHQTPEARAAFQAFRTPGVGERLILEENVFVERVLPGATVRQLSDEEIAVYGAPFPTPESRRPIWRLPNELPIAGEPADVDASLRQAHTALRAARYPKLLFAADPGALVSPAFAERLPGELHDCRLVKLGAGRHYLQEDHPDAMGRAIADWIVELEARAPRSTRDLAAAAAQSRRRR